MNPDLPAPNSPADRLSWSTPAPALIAVAVGGVAMAVATFFAADGPSRLLVGLAALGLLAMAGLGFRQRPRLAVVAGEPPRMVVRGLLRPREYVPTQIVRARIVGYRRLGRKMPMVEIDVVDDEGERLLIFGRWDLGADPTAVYEDLVGAMRLSRDKTS
ncbi:PH domain-containing protein [Nocardia callitridis]|uniref:PH domain-containing protein n=1 Tax=Nocardia callitridis TaxID=648753 RepID=A0ABP9JWX6_9NOCA